MKELLGKLSALDPEAGDALKVVSYFDTLMDGRVSIETLIRGAATLSGVPAGYLKAGKVIRVLADGRRGQDADSGLFTSVAAGYGAFVWIEREGSAHANDDMIRERLAVAVARNVGRDSGQSPERNAVELLLTAPLGDDQRRAAEARLRLDPIKRFRAVALRSDVAVDRDFPSTILATPWGLVRGGIVHSLDEVPSSVWTGVGLDGRISELATSWRTALVSLALTDEANPLVYAEELGSIIHLADLINDSSEIPVDVASVDTAIQSQWTTSMLQGIADGDSIRAIATAAGLHHSTVHSRLPELTRLLGFDPLTPLGRTRLFVALLLRRIAHARFDEV